jgi:hypothetical protein
MSRNISCMHGHVHIFSCMLSTQVLTCTSCENPGVCSCFGRAGGHGPFLTRWCHVMYVEHARVVALFVITVERILDVLTTAGNN